MKLLNPIITLEATYGCCGGLFSPSVRYVGEFEAESAVLARLFADAAAQAQYLMQTTHHVCTPSRTPPWTEHGEQHE